MNTAPALRPILAFALLSIGMGSAAASDPANDSPKPGPIPSLKPGDPVNWESLAGAQWLQGKAPTSFEPGKVYVIECWTTSCGPCVASIPHINALHKRYADKGLRVVGVAVHEKDTAKVADFVKQKGERMSYPVACVGDKSTFEHDWLDACGETGIPLAFIVRDGKVLTTASPWHLSDSNVKALLGEDTDREKAVAKILASKAAFKKTVKLATSFEMAQSGNKFETMATTLAKLEALDADSPFLPNMRLSCHIAKNEWSSAIQDLKNFPAYARPQETFEGIDNWTDTLKTPCDPAFLSAMATTYGELLKEDRDADAMAYYRLARLYWKAGDKAAALAGAKQAVTVASNPPPNTGHLFIRWPAATFDRLVKSIADGHMPDTMEIMQWVNDAEEAEKSKTQPQP